VFLVKGDLQGLGVCDLCDRHRVLVYDTGTGFLSFCGPCMSRTEQLRCGCGALLVRVENRSSVAEVWDCPERDVRTLAGHTVVYR
jgi:hypothetical protein